MALFKILKGDSSRIDMSVTPFHDGYAYFTPDDGGFYIDTLVNGEEKRIRINPTQSQSGPTKMTWAQVMGMYTWGHFYGLT